MNYLKDFLDVQLMAIKNTFKSIRYIFIVAVSILAGSLAMNIISNILYTIFKGGVLGLFVNLGIYILELFILSFIMNILYKAIRSNSNTQGFFQDDNGRFVSKLIQIGFIFYIAQLFISFLGLGPIYYYITFIIILLFNALPESIYLENYDGVNTIMFSVEFLAKNLLNWLVPNIIIYLVFYVLKIQYILPFNIIFTTNIQQILIKIATIVLYSGLLIYRGNLFDILNGSSMRKREYMRKFN